MKEIKTVSVLFGEPRLSGVDYRTRYQDAIWNKGFITEVFYNHHQELMMLNVRHKDKDVNEDDVRTVSELFDGVDMIIAMRKSIISNGD